MEVVQNLEAAQWREFVMRHPHGSIFHTPEMYEVLACAKGYCPMLWAVVDKGEILALLLPVQITLFSFLSVLTTRAVSYGGLLCRQDSQGTLAARRLLQAYAGQTRSKAVYSELRNLHAQTPLRPIYDECGFVYEEHLNYLIDLTRSSDRVFQQIGGRTRKHIRRGLRRGDVTIAEAENSSDVAACYDLISRTYQRAHVPLADRSLFEAAFELLAPRHMLRLYLAYLKDRPVAASAELFYKDTIYGWYSGLDRSFSEYTPNDLLMWHVLCWGADNGYAIYDFGGAGKPGEKYGVRDFKAKFGGKLVEYGRYSVTHAPLRFELSKLGYLVYQRLSYLKSGY
jgi:serine/alanine adding enzyme